MYLYPGVGANYGWIKGKSVLTFVMYVAQVTDICTLPKRKYSADDLGLCPRSVSTVFLL